MGKSRGRRRKKEKEESKKESKMEEIKKIMRKQKKNWITLKKHIEIARNRLSTDLERKYAELAVLHYLCNPITYRGQKEKQEGIDTADSLTHT